MFFFSMLLLRRQVFKRSSSVWWWRSVPVPLHQPTGSWRTCVGGRLDFMSMCRNAAGSNARQPELDQWVWISLSQELLYVFPDIFTVYVGCIYGLAVTRRPWWV